MHFIKYISKYKFQLINFKNISMRIYIKKQQIFMQNKIKNLFFKKKNFAIKLDMLNKKKQ